MKIKLVYINILILLFTFLSCKKTKDIPTIEDHYLNYEISEIPVTEDYKVGTFYSVFTTFNANVKEVPVLGKYTMNNTTGVSAAIMDKHIEYATKGGIDFFIFQLRSFNRAAANATIDQNYINSFLNRNTDNKMKFAINFNFSTYSLTTSALLENDATKLAQFYNDFEKMETLLKNPNYMKIDGKPLIYINESRNLYSANNKAIYAEIRRRMSLLGIELYIVGHQERWSPPARYAPYRFEGCVDAVYHGALLLSTAYAWDLFYIFPQAMDQNYKYNREYIAENYKLDFIPNIFPGNDFNISAAANRNPNIERKDGGAMYKKLCNVAKMNASNKTRLIMIDSFNDWVNGTQLEPAESYGELYLNITRQQFKK